MWSVHLCRQKAEIVFQLARRPAKPGGVFVLTKQLRLHQAPVVLALKLQSEQLVELRKRAEQIGVSDDVTRVGMRGVSNYLRDWFFNLDNTRPNKFGGPRTHFFGNVARSVQNPVVSGGVGSVSINQVGLAARLLGATIHAGVGTSSATGKPTEFLALPARTEAYGKTPAQFHDLVFVREKRGGGAMLVQALQSQFSRGKKGARNVREVGGLVMFWLVKEVTIKPDPSLMPSDAQLTQAAVTPATNYLARRLQS
jgi:hypothetical protein